MNRDFKGVWIEKDIWLNTELTILEKVIYAEIDSLDNENHCTASNEYFAEFCDCSTSKVSKAIKKLQGLGMIDVMSFDGRHRRIRVVKNARQTSKKYEADSQKMLTNNISNKQDSNKKSISKDIDNREIEWFLENYHNICVSLPKVMKLSDKRKKAVLKILNNFSKDNILECFELAEQSDFLKGNNDRGWKADIDFILREDKFISILEGKYGGRKKKSNTHDRLNESGDLYVEHSRKEDRNYGTQF